MLIKNYANLVSGQTHYRRAGEGSPMVLLHASPMSSQWMEPFFNTLHDVADVIAPDTPGYGNSDPLPAALLETTTDLSPYVEWLHEFIEKMGLDKIGLYGTATGAQIAIEYARTYPEKLNFVILDNAAHFTDHQRKEIMAQYFPDIAAKADGSHLLDVWNMAAGSSQWFPWYAQDDEHKIADAKPPAALVHAMTMAYLSAGEDYAQAYRRAFLNEDANRVVDIKVPVRVIRWSNSILKKYSDQYDQYDFPEHIQMCFCAGGPEERFAAIRSAATEFLNQT